MAPMPDNTSVRAGTPRRAGLVAGVCAALLAALLPVVSHAGSLERRGGFRELSVPWADAVNGVVLPDLFVVAGSDSVRLDDAPLARGSRLHRRLRLRRGHVRADGPRRQRAPHHLPLRPP